jgi:murein endopeptidase
VRLLCLILLTAVACGFVTPSARDPRPAPIRNEPTIDWHHSRALGTPGDGRLVRGVRLPGDGAHFFTWDPLLHRSPNRAWRRWGTDQLVRVILRVTKEFAAAHPRAARIGVGDLSRPHGGYFGPKHATHQNGLDADVYYPRLDGRERPPTRVEQIDLRLAQELVDLFVAAGAELVYVGPNTPLTGPPGVVIPLWNHDNHLHVRIRFRPSVRGNP